MKTLKLLKIINRNCAAYIINAKNIKLLNMKQTGVQNCIQKKNFLYFNIDFLF